MARLDLTLLGGFRARLVPGAPPVLPARKGQALLAYLALPPGEAHPRDKLAALLWGDRRHAQARASLRQVLATLRKALADCPALRAEGESVAIDPSAVSVDTGLFERGLEGNSISAPEKATATRPAHCLDHKEPRHALRPVHDAAAPALSRPRRRL